MGGETTPSRGIVQSAGSAYRVAGSFLKEEFLRAGTLQRLLLLYIEALITQMSRRRPYAIVITPWTSSFAAGC